MGARALQVGERGVGSGHEDFAVVGRSRNSGVEGRTARRLWVGVLRAVGGLGNFAEGLGSFAEGLDNSTAAVDSSEEELGKSEVVAERIGCSSVVVVVGRIGCNCRNCNWLLGWKGNAALRAAEVEIERVAELAVMGGSGMNLEVGCHSYGYW